VNSIKFHPQHGTFVTAGGDGTYNFWDKDSKQRLKVSGLLAFNRARAYGAKHGHHGGPSRNDS